MTKRKALMVLDSLMLISFMILMSWRLSGVSAHEWIGFAMIGLIFTHLVIHWGWVESTVTKAVQSERRGRVVPLLLNTALFITMGTALISGVVISKVVLPNKLLPGDYLQWHGLHETSATITLIIVGLHLAMNWDRVRSGFRRFFSASRAATRAASTWFLPPAAIARRIGWVSAISLVLIAAIWGKTRLLPSHPQVLMMFPDGHTAVVDPPADIAQLHPGSNTPDFNRGAARLAMALVVLPVSAVVGRKVLRLRLRA